MHKSKFFKDIFKLPQYAGSFEGLKDDHPIIINGIDQRDFNCLLEYLYDQ